MTVFRSTLAPAVKIMNRLRYPRKFALIFVAVLIPVLFLSGMVLQQINDEIRFLENERRGVRYIESVVAVIDPIQQHRGVMATLLSGGDTSLQSRADSLRSQVEAGLGALETLDGNMTDTLSNSATVASIRQRWQNLTGEVESLTPEQTFARHTELIQALTGLVTTVADQSEITLDPSLDTYYLGDSLANTIPALTESMGQARALASQAATIGLVDEAQRIRLEVLLAKIEDNQSSLSSGLQAAMRQNPALASMLRTSLQESDASIEALRSLIRNRLLEVDFVMVNGPEVFETATQSIDATYDLFDDTVPAMEGILAERIQRDITLRNVDISIVVLVIIGLTWLFAALYQSIVESIEAISEVARQVADGDMSARVELSTRDETRRIADGFNAMTTQFARMIREIIQASAQLASAAEEMSGVARHSAENIQQQRAETDQVATAMNEMNATVQEVAGSASNASNAARDTDEQSRKGSTVVREASQRITTLAGEIDRSSESVQRVSQDSEAITSVLDVIKGIAEQTNLLALNAAIEAARAGEQGRGFAVVADEVRTLASRTQQSAAEISDMIDQLHSGVDDAVQMMDSSRRSAHEGVSLVQQAAGALDAITDAVTTISDMNTHIATAVEQQSSTAEEINRNITSIRDLAEQSSTGAEQSTVASDELARLASDLQRQTARFRVEDA